MDKIFLLKKGKYISGPFSIEQLKESGAKDSDKFWYEGLADWQNVSSLQEYGIEIRPSADNTIKKSRGLMFWKKVPFPKQ